MVFIEDSKYLSKDTAKNYNRTLPNYFFFDFERKEYIEEEKIIEKLLENIDFNSSLELGVGTGRISKHIIGKSKKYHGIDISQSMIDFTSKKYTQDSVTFEVSDINKFIDVYEDLKEFDFISSFWAFNYAILSYFEYHDFETKKNCAYSNLEESNRKAKQQIDKLFNKLSSGTKFLFFYFDAYSVEQSYVTSVLEKDLPFPYHDRGYTFKVFKQTLEENPNIEFSNDHLNGYVKLEDEQHLLDYFSTLHLYGYINEADDIEALFRAFETYRQNDSSYHIPAGMNVIKGEVK